MGFDPLHAENWYSVKREQLMSFKVLPAHCVRLLSLCCFFVFYSLTQYLISLLLSQGATSILKSYGGSVGRAISNIFPNLGFNIRSYYRLHCKYLSILEPYLRHLLTLKFQGIPRDTGEFQRIGETFSMSYHVNSDLMHSSRRTGILLPNLKFMQRRY